MVHHNSRRRLPTILLGLSGLVVCLALPGFVGCGLSFPVQRRPIIEETHVPEGMVEVPAGPFTMGDDHDTSVGDAMPARVVRLDRFFIDRHEVTVAAYRTCVDAGECDPPTLSSHYCSGDDEASNNWNKHDRDDHPVNCIDWDQADAFCKWAGKRLPTEAEWEKAARGPDPRTYPWGEASASCEYAVMLNAGVQGCGEETTAAVGSKPEGMSPYGALDMAGNVFEWTADWYASDYYTKSPEENPPGPESGTSDSRVARGGALDNNEREMRTIIRTPVTPTFTADNLGVRCALTPP